MNRATPKVFWLLSALLALYLVLPFLAGLGQAGLADWRSADLGAISSAVGVSIASATIAVFAVTLGGVPLGYLLARSESRWMEVLGFIVQLPLALPPLASGVLLLFLLGYSSPLGALTNGALTDSFAGIVLAEAFVAAPFLIISARSAFAGVDPGLEDVAATLGHAPWSVFRRVVIPLASRTILAGMLLAWLRAFGEFGATVMVAYHPYSLPVYTYVAFGGEGLPAMIPVLAPTLVAALGVMFVSVLLSRPRRSRETHPAACDLPRPLPEAPIAIRFGAERGETLDFAFRQSLSGFDLDVAWRTRGRRLAILGASGSGKSMTLRHIAGLEPSGEQKIRICGRDVIRLPPHERAVAYVPQNLGLFPHLAVADQLRFAPDADMKAVAFWVERLGLSGLERRKPDELSLGQQQRVALARALCRPADLILLDEPFSALDAPLRATLRRELQSLQQEIEATTILVTHDPEEALELADDLMILQEGRVLQAGCVEDVFARPAHEMVARLLGAENVGSGTARGSNSIELRPGTELETAGPPLSAGQKVRWAVKRVRIQASPTGRYSGRIIWKGEPRAGVRPVGVQFGGSILEMEAPASQELGAHCRFDVDPQSVQVWSAQAEETAAEPASQREG